VTATKIRRVFEHFTPDSCPYGLTYGQWTVKWWQWLASIPADINPAADIDGKNASVGQEDPHVWFLAGTLGGKAVSRSCKVPYGKAVLFPVINYEVNPLEKQELISESELIADASRDEDDVLRLWAEINGESIPIFRVRSDPPLFSLTIPTDNPFNSPSGTTTKATSDGYWVFLKPLDRGNYNLCFNGACSAGIRNVSAIYHLEVA
jgi:hypothetical protein